jgi:hypothetical protein
MGGGGRACSTDEWTRAYGEVAWFWRRNAGAKPAEQSAGDGDTAAHRGDRDISRKAIAQGMSDCLRSPVCSCAVFVAQAAHTGPRVQRAPGIPCSLWIREGQRDRTTRARCAARTPILAPRALTASAGNVPRDRPPGTAHGGEGYSSDRKSQRSPAAIAAVRDRQSRCTGIAPALNL